MWSYLLIIGVGLCDATQEGTNSSYVRSKRHYGPNSLPDYTDIPHSGANSFPLKHFSTHSSAPESSASLFSVFASAPDHVSHDFFGGYSPSGSFGFPKSQEDSSQNHHRGLDHSAHPFASNSFSGKPHDTYGTKESLSSYEPDHHHGNHDYHGPHSSSHRDCSSHGCSAIITCAPFFDELLKSHSSTCSLHKHARGVCCPPMQQSGYRAQGIRQRGVFVPIPNIGFGDINRGASEALSNLRDLDNFNTLLQQNNVMVSDATRPAFRHLQFFRNSPAGQTLGRHAWTLLLTSSSLTKRFNLNSAEAGFGLTQLNAQFTMIDETCPGPVDCRRKADFYRTADGTCNNRRNARLGSAGTTYNRLILPQYENGIESPRTLSKTGVELPSARLVSVTNVADLDRPSPEYSLVLMQWGQFINHDMTFAAMRRLNQDSGIECCDNRGQFIAASFKHTACFPIEIPADDPFFSKFNRRCMNFVRTQIAPKPNCTLGYVEQVNQNTHFLDGSMIYGSSQDTQNALRQFQGGLLRTQNKKLLPVNNNITMDQCDLEGTRMQCFLAGDTRVMQQPDLTAMHTLFVRHHNNIARKLSHINPHWNDERIFQETRRIVAAQIQHITYNEFLPPVIGTEFSRKNGLLPLQKGFSNQYDSSEDPRILNEFSTVAFRFGHTLVEGIRDLFDKYHEKTHTILLHNHFNSARLIYIPGKVEEFLRGLAKQPMQSFDNYVSESLTNRLFQTNDMPFGMDLVSLNIQRGRDHAIAPYVQLREVCGLGRARNFKDLSDVLRGNAAERFRRLYPSVQDIDPFIAGISEIPAPDAIVGPTFRCIIAEQFRRLRQGDRFFYDNGGMKSSFTPGQLYEIRQTSYARIFCDNGWHIKEMQPLAFKLPGPLNEKVSCSSPAIPRLDLRAWAERH